MPLTRLRWAASATGDKSDDDDCESSISMPPMAIGVASDCMSIISMLNRQRALINSVKAGSSRFLDVSKSLCIVRWTLSASISANRGCFADRVLELGLADGCEDDTERTGGPGPGPARLDGAILAPLAVST